MGRPSKIKPVSVGPSRRGFFKATGTAALALGSLHGASFGAQTSVFQHGVASGDPLSDRVILWTRVTPPEPIESVTVSYVVATDPGLKNVVKTGSTKTYPGRDFTVKVDRTGLKPGTTYYYRFSALDQSSPIGRTKTLPVGSVASLRFAVVSCSNHAYGYFNVYARLAERADLDLVMHLGDYIYEYGEGQYGTARTPSPANEIVSLSDYRLRHAQYKADVDSQAMHRQHPLVAIWDDHETANNAWKGGAENHTPGTEGDWKTRVANALQAYYEWMPVRVVDADNLRKNNRAFSFGNLAELIMLEERVSARSEQVTTLTHATVFGAGFATSDPGFSDPTRSLLGAAQESWLTTRLRTSPAKWKLLGQGVMFAQLKAPSSNQAADPGLFYINSDQWDGYEPARNRVYDVLAGDASNAAVNNVALLTGDIHSSWASDLSPNPYNPNPATGGYYAATGEGSRAVEFVGPSVSSPGIDTDTTGQIAGALRYYNPHFKYIDLTRRGYMLLDVNAQRMVSEWWYVDTALSPSSVQTFGTAFQVIDGSNRLTPGAKTPDRDNPPPLAPDRLPGNPPR
jgi:alkaline phosphatase D